MKIILSKSEIVYTDDESANIGKNWIIAGDWIFHINDVEQILYTGVDDE